MTPAQRRSWRPVLAAALAALIVASLGGLMTDIGPWYQSLRRPSWQPPDWLFGPAWTLIFALAASSGALAWRHARFPGDRQRIIAAFALNAFFNVMWSALFFGLRRPDWALAEVCFLWLSIVLLIVGLAPISRTAAWLLAPYLVWVSFAAVLNLEVVLLNVPFGGS